MISCLHPSRGRPEKSILRLKAWGDACPTMPIEHVEWIVSLDYDDPLLDKYKELYELYYRDKVTIIINKNRSAVDAINNAAKQAKGDMFIVVSDDTEPAPHWAREINNHYRGRVDWILKTNDGTQPWIITNPIMDRTYYNRFGYIYHPDYKHMFCDTELTCVADLTGRKITSNILFKHNHYSVTKEPPDAISKRADGTWDQGEKLFLERYKRNFDLKPEDIKGKIQDNGMINWLKRKIH